MEQKLQYSREALAYLGDSVIEILVRETLVKSGISSSSALNSNALKYVKASEQASAVKKILPILDEEETAVFKRGRNTGHTNVPKNATTADYRAATGMETLFGYLHLSGKKERIRELFELAYGKDEIQTE